jgi:hypothetical protein
LSTRGFVGAGDNAMIGGAIIGSGEMQAVNATQLAPTDDREAAIVAPFLTPGNYTAVVEGKDGATGVALVEAYRIP